MIKPRNLTSHTDNPEITEDIVKKHHYPLLPRLCRDGGSIPRPGGEGGGRGMNHGPSEETIAAIRGVFMRFPIIKSAVLYGSRAKGTFKPGSDIDLTLHGKNLTTTRLADIADTLDEFDLPYTIDLSIFEKLDAPALREHIERVGIPIYP